MRLGWVEDGAGGGVAWPGGVRSAGSVQAQSGAAMPKMARDADPDWDVVTVKPSDPDSKELGYRISGRREIQLLRQTAEAMLIVGYGVHKKQIAEMRRSGRGPRSGSVKGETDLMGEPDAQQVRSLVQKLLKERFGLVVHTEQREMPVFALDGGEGRGEAEGE